jgi:hypothetical protein
VTPTLFGEVPTSDTDSRELEVGRYVGNSLSADSIFEFGVTFAEGVFVCPDKCTKLGEVGVGQVML